MSNIDDVLASMGDKLASKEYTLSEFVHKVYVRSFPGKSFDYWHINEVIKEIELCFETQQHLVVVWPRFHLKSTVPGYATAIWTLLKGYNVIYLSYSYKMAEYHSKKIKEYILNNPELSSRMKDLSPASDSVCRFLVDGVSKVEILIGGIYSFKRGTHVKGVVILDDILRDPETPLSFEQIKKVTEHFKAEIINMPVEGAICIIMGTPMHPEDLLMTLEDQEGFKYIRWSAFNPVPGREVLWPEVYSAEFLERHKRISGWRSFQTEFMLVPVSETESYFTSDEIIGPGGLVDPSLKCHSIEAVFRRPPEMRYVLGGADLGKKRHPSHLSIFGVEVDAEGKPICTMLHQSWLDEMPYLVQKEYFEKAVDNFKMDALYLDDTRGEMSERDLDPLITLISFASAQNRKRAITTMDEMFTQKRVKLLGEPRFVSQLLAVRGDLTAPETSSGHGESFFSIALAMLALDDRLGRGGTQVVGNVANVIVGRSEPKLTLVCEACKSPAISFFSQKGHTSYREEAIGYNCLDCGHHVEFELPEREKHSLEVI